MSQEAPLKFDKIIKDIRNGENYDLYILIISAFVLVAISIYGIETMKYIYIVTMSSLAIVAYNVVNIKQRMGEIELSIRGKDTGSQLVTEFAPDFREDIESSTEIWMAGIHLSSTITAYHDNFMAKLQSGGKLRFLLVDPEGHAAVMATKRFPGTVHKDQEKSRIMSSLNLLSELQEKYPRNVEIRVLDYLFDSTIYHVNPGKSHAKIYIEKSTYKVSGGIHKPKFSYTKSNNKWYNQISTEYNNMWLDAKIWTNV